MSDIKALSRYLVFEVQTTERPTFDYDKLETRFGTPPREVDSLVLRLRQIYGFKYRLYKGTFALWEEPEIKSK